MPLSFASNSHGPIPFGFFNIETDLLLLDRVFFFATDFCEWIVEWAGNDAFSHDRREVFIIQDAKQIGDLGCAIHGFEFAGFINDVYQRFPFPRERSGFKQKPYGPGNRPVVETLLRSFAAPLNLPILFSRETRTVAFGPYEFSAVVFQDLIRYVQAGGMPGWLDGQPPGYVERMTARVAASGHWYFSG